MPYIRVASYSIPMYLNLSHKQTTLYSLKPTLDVTRRRLFVGGDRVNMDQERGLRTSHDPWQPSWKVFRMAPSYGM
ncbi:hypothetical protein NDU88_001969 [Pleurodeles waltl]|uniref:Uncharacterized protein n=1 Tax=Pleurodeles waltl TaxID=8319 RepID=A0AAV7KU16_PLEWA|nr:hypothetical protein NDU88_001969 [Pleurodeles waltl]